MEKKKIIFDTDIGGDCDDVIALDVLLALEARGECELLAITVSNPAERAAECACAIVSRYRKGGALPVGRMGICNEKSNVYANAVYEKFGYDEGDAVIEESAVGLLRKTLAGLPEGGKATLTVTGPLSNIAELIESKGDEFSPLDGASLLREKVCEIVLMGGCLWYMSLQNPKPGLVLEDGTVRAVGECNIVADIPSSKKVFGLSGMKITVCPFEVGWNMLTGKPIIERSGENEPDSLALLKYGATEGRDSWDPTTALLSVRGARPLFYRSAPGRIEIKDDGLMVYHYDPEGKHTFVECAAERDAIAGEINSLISELR